MVETTFVTSCSRALVSQCVPHSRASHPSSMLWHLTKHDKIPLPGLSLRTVNPSRHSEMQSPTVTQLDAHSGDKTIFCRMRVEPHAPTSLALAVSGYQPWTHRSFPMPHRPRHQWHRPVAVQTRKTRTGMYNSTSSDAGHLPAKCVKPWPR